MGVMGVLMYVAAPQIIGVMTPVEEIRMLGIGILRIEALRSRCLRHLSSPTVYLWVRAIHLFPV